MDMSSQDKSSSGKSHHAGSYQPKVVVSLTSFPGAIMFAVDAIRSILAGSVIPDKIVLYLNFQQFDKGIPSELRELCELNDIVEIRGYEREMRSYCKLVPALADFPEDIIVTVDDDVDYHRHLLRDLLRWHLKHPDLIIAHRAKRIKPGKPYRKWKKIRWYHFLIKSNWAAFNILQTGVGGVLYPPHSLRADMIDPDKFTRLAPTQDDIWFWAAATANGTKVFPVPFGCNKPKDLPKPRNLKLKVHNFKGGVDRNREALRNILNAYPELAERLEGK